MDYLSVKEAAEKWGVSERRVHQYCKDRRIPGTERIGNTWAIPATADKPQDPRSVRKNSQSIVAKKKIAVKTENVKVGAVIAAAGVMNQEDNISPMMNLDGTSIIRRMILIFQQLSVFPIVVVTGHQALELEQHLINYGIIFIRNENYLNSDKFESAKLGFQFLREKCDKVFFTSVKVPFFTSDTLRQMIWTDGTVIVPTYHGRKGHPILLKQEAIERIISYEGKDGLRGAITSSEYQRTFLEVEDEGVLLSTDSIARMGSMTADKKVLLHPFVQISIERGGILFDGRARLLLILIQETKSVQSACRQIAMSRGKAWDMINQMEQGLGFTVVTRRQGGSKGGKTELTEKGVEFLKRYQEYEDMVKEYSRIQFMKKFEEYL